MENLPYTIPPGAFFLRPQAVPSTRRSAWTSVPRTARFVQTAPQRPRWATFRSGLPNGDILQSGGPDENLVWHQRLTPGQALPSQRLGYRLLNLSQLLVRKALVRLGPDVGQVNEFVYGHIPGPIQPTGQQGNVGGIGTGETQ